MQVADACVHVGLKPDEIERSARSGAPTAVAFGEAGYGCVCCITCNERWACIVIRKQKVTLMKSSCSVNRLSVTRV